MNKTNNISDKDLIQALQKQIEEEEREIKRLIRELAVQKEEVTVQKEIIENQRDSALRQRDEIVSQQKEITASFTYASRIQDAMLTSSTIFEKHLKDYFIFYKPRNIVSGDFYWMTEKNDKIIVTAADATGHGVPGAFMSLMGIVFLNEIVNSLEITTPHEILERMRKKVVAAFEREDGRDTVNAGMDLALVSIDIQNMKLQFSGAFNPVCIYRKEELIELPGDKIPVGFHPYLMDNKFITKDFKLLKGDRIFLFSDGFIDQFGWRSNKKYLKRNFKNLLLENQSVPLKAQRLLLENALNNWKGDLEQVDDIVVLGFEI